MKNSESQKVLSFFCNVRCNNHFWTIVSINILVLLTIINKFVLITKLNTCLFYKIIILNLQV